MRAPTTNTPVSEISEAHSAGFTLTLKNFEGPFDLLLSLLSRRKLEITDVALAEVTEEFLQYINRLFEVKSDSALNEASDFLVTAATLLDLKAARLLPRAKVDSAEDIALLEARDLLFARLLQYRAYREVAAVLGERYREQSELFPRDVALEPQFKKVLPELVFETSPEQFAEIAAKALRVSEGLEEHNSLPISEMDHLQEPATTIAAEETFIEAQLAETSTLRYSQLIEHCGNFEIAVFRFLAILEMWRRGVIEVQQESPLGEIVMTSVNQHEPERSEL